MVLGNWLSRLGRKFETRRGVGRKRSTLGQTPVAPGQVLEERLVLSVNSVVDTASKTLVITGTEGDDAVKVYDYSETRTLENGRWTTSRTDTGYIYVQDESGRQAFRKSGFNKISFVGLGGDDVFEASGDESTPNSTFRFNTSMSIVVDGGAGNDFIRTASYPDTVLGGDGNDTIQGQAHHDRLEGGDGDDVLEGGNDNDTLIGGAGHDSLTDDHGHDVAYGDDGDDTINTGLHHDTIYGGAGNDVLDGGAWSDRIYGDEGNDVITDDDGHELVYGGDGDDTISTGLHHDTIYGGAGNDVIDGGLWSDRIYGDDGDDLIIDDDGQELVYGGEGDDTISTGLHSDTIYGGAGNDVIDGGRSSDRIWGDDGDDLITDDDGQELVYGGNGNDTISTGLHHDTIYGGAGNDVLDGGLWSDQIWGDDGDDLITDDDGREVVVGGNGNDTISTGALDDTIYGGDGFDLIDSGDDADYVEGGRDNDTINGGGGNDRLYGMDGDDLLVAGTGNDTVNGGVGNDTAEAGDGNDFVDLYYGDDLASGGAGKDTIYGSAGRDTINGGDGNDSLYGHSDDDTVNGDDGNDRIYGHEGNDVLFGGTGNDYFEGSYGNDTIRGGFGEDTLYGGSGNDWLYGAGDASTASPRDELRGQSGDDILLGGTAYDNEGRNLGGGSGALQVAQLVSPYALQVGTIGSDISYTFESDQPWLQTATSFSTDGNVELVGTEASIFLTTGLSIAITQSTPLGTVVEIDESFSLPQLPEFAGFDIDINQFTFGFMSGAAIRASVDPDAPVFDEGLFFVGAAGLKLEASSGTVSVSIPETSSTIIVDPVRGLGYFKGVANGYTIAIGVAVQDDLAFRPQALPENYTDLIGGNVYVQVDGIEILKVLSVGGAAVIDLPDDSAAGFHDGTLNLIDQAFSGELNGDSIESLLDMFADASIGVMGNLDFSLDVVNVELGDASLIYNGDLKDLYFRAQSAESPLTSIPILRQSGVGDLLRVSGPSYVDGFLDLDHIGNSVVKMNNGSAQFEVDFDRGVTLGATIATPLASVSAEGFIGFNGDVRLDGHAQMGASVDVKIADVGIRFDCNLVIEGNFITGDLIVDASMDFNIYGIVKLDFYFFSLKFGAAGWAHAGLHMELQDFKDFSGSFRVEAGIRIYYGPGSFSAGGGGSITVDSRGLLVDIDGLPSFRLG